MPHPDGSIEDLVDMSAQSEIDLAVPDAADLDVSIENANEVMLARSVANIAIAPKTSTDNTIDQLTEQLAAFCIGHIEKTLNLSDRSDGVDINLDAEALEEELRVQDNGAVITEMLISCTHRL